MHGGHAWWKASISTCLIMEERQGIQEEKFINMNLCIVVVSRIFCSKKLGAEASIEVGSN